MISKCPYPCDNKTNMGYCQTTACVNPMFSNIGSWNYSLYQQKRIITNADRIRAMSDEELADFLCSTTSHNTVNCAYCIAEDYCKMGRNGFVDWLKQECEE